VQPAVHVFGHVHEQNGAELMENTWHVNAALDGGGDAIVFDVEFTDQD
jgi:Icc-related predicted phosphoesterase